MILRHALNGARVAAATLLVLGCVLVVVPLEWWPVWIVIMGTGLAVGLWQTRDGRADDPAIPVGVRVRLDDGSEVPCECVYDGYRDGMHVWTATLTVPAQRVVALLADELPAKTTIQIPTS